MTSARNSTGRMKRPRRSVSRSLPTEFAFGAWQGVGRRPHKVIPRAHPSDIAWPSGEGREIGTIRGSVADMLDVLRRRLSRGRVREQIYYGEDGSERAVVVGPPSRTLACLLADESQAPGVVSVVADAGADPDLVVKAVGRVLGRGFEVRRHAV
jgi:hypothetical protein